MNFNKETFEKLMSLVKYGEGCEEACKQCPYKEQCEKEEGWWGCPCWEEGMGEDL